MPFIRLRNLKVFNVSSKSREAGDTQPITSATAFPPNELYRITKIFKMTRGSIYEPLYHILK
jgi:hypothetical protein